MTPALLDTDMLSELIKLQNPTVRQHAVDYTQQFGQLSFSFAPIARARETRLASSPSEVQSWSSCQLFGVVISG